MYTYACIQIHVFVYIHGCNAFVCICARVCICACVCTHRLKLLKALADLPLHIDTLTLERHKSMLEVCVRANILICTHTHRNTRKSAFMYPYTHTHTHVLCTYVHTHKKFVYVHTPTLLHARDVCACAYINTKSFLYTCVGCFRATRPFAMSQCISMHIASVCVRVCVCVCVRVCVCTNTSVL